MNKYVLRTSLVWIIVFAAVAGIWAYRSYLAKQPHAMMMPMSSDLQPVAAGPSPVTQGSTPSTSEMKTEAPLAPVQLSPERMQSIGVKLGTVKYKQLNNDIRATGTVDIDERLLSYVQVRFPGYIRKVFANATYQYVRKGEPLFNVYSPDLVATQQECHVFTEPHILQQRRTARTCCLHVLILHKKGARSGCELLHLISPFSKKPTGDELEVLLLY